MRPAQRKTRCRNRNCRELLTRQAVRGQRDRLAKHGVDPAAAAELLPLCPRCVTWWLKHHRNPAGHLIPAH